jgi:Txe/YoeB family toxin of Txe-Axe toxin-antitoxin module
LTWTAIRTGRFKHGYKAKTRELQIKVDEAIKLILGSKDPRNLGGRKYGSREGTYGHDIDYRHRLLFSVDISKKEVYFLRVCSHKEVYGSS